MEEQVKAIMADLFTVAEASIDDRTSMETVERWDSLAQIDLIAALEEEFGVTFEVEEFEIMTSYPEVLDVLSEKI